MLANGGRAHQADADRPHPGPHRAGRSTATTTANAPAATPRSGSTRHEPRLVDNREQVLDPLTAYQITSILEGVVQRGTAQVVKAVGKPLAGKTGTTNDAKDVWFVGFSPDLAVGVFIGYDKPQVARQLGHRRPVRGAGLPRLHADGAEGQAGDAVPRARRASSSSAISASARPARRLAARARASSSRRSSPAPLRPTPIR